MSCNTKDDITQVDLASTSISTDMSLLDELFPSLGNGESSASHFTNQLAFLLNTLGSSDDEGTEGSNFLSPLQLSPPRLNEIHALATANLISQTQEAIMQEYNITDLDFEKTLPADNVENTALLSADISFKDDSQSCNDDEIHVLDHSILGSCIESTDFHRSGAPDSGELESDLNIKLSGIKNHVIDIPKTVENKSLGSGNDTPKEMFVDSIYVVKENHNTSNENESLTNLEIEAENSYSASTAKSEKSLGTRYSTKTTPSSQLTIPDKLNTQCSATVSDASILHNSDVNSSTDNHQTENSKSSKLYGPKSIETMSHPPAKRSIESSDVCPNETLECGHVNTYTQMKNTSDILSCILPPKKRFLENTVAIKVSEMKNGLENGTWSGCGHTTDSTLVDRFSGCISSGKSIGDKEKAQPADRRILFVCVMCLKQFSCIEDLEGHFPCHQQYSCPYPGCKRTFSYRSHLSYHKQTHDGEKSYQCTECQKVFIKAQHLQVHMVTHSQSKPFSCSVCNKGFSTAGNLKNHTRTHSGEKPYACDINGCTKTFAELSSLKKHKITHTGVRPYRCDICGKCFTQASSKSYHIKKHKDQLESVIKSQSETQLISN